MKLWRVVVLSAGAGFFSLSTMAAETTGTVGVTLELTNGCLVNGAPDTANVDLGTLDFGSHAATFDELSATFSSAGGSNAFTVECSDGQAPEIKLTSSANNTAPTTLFATGGNRYLLLSSDTNTGIGYTVYDNSAQTTGLADGDVIASIGNTAGVYSYGLWGKIVGGGNSTSVPAGLYSDTLNITITY